MKKNLFQVTSLLFIILLFISCDDSSTSVSKTAKLKGNVFNLKTNAPIEKAFIFTEPPTTTTISDSKGQFVLEILNSGTYIISAMKSGYYSNKISVTVETGITTVAYIPMYDSAYLNHSPEKPTLLNPYNNAKINSFVELLWDCSDSDGDPLTYDVLLDNNPIPTTIIYSTISQKNITVNNLIPNKKYYWRISARDKYGAMSESDIFSFSVDTTAINIPNLVLYLNFNKNNDIISPYIFKSSSNIISYVADRFNNVYGAAYFNGTKNVIVEKAPELELTNEFTISAWLKPDIGYGVNHNGWVILCGRWKATGTKTSTYALVINVNSSRLAGFTHDGKTNSQCTANTVFQTGIWTHVAYTYKAGVAKIYINGALSNSSSVVAPQESDYDLLIGMEDDGENAYLGAMDDLYVFNKALTDIEISNLAK